MPACLVSRHFFYGVHGSAKRNMIRVAIVEDESREIGALQSVGCLMWKDQPNFKEGGDIDLRVWCVSHHRLLAVVRAGDGRSRQYVGRGSRYRRVHKDRAVQTLAHVFRHHVGEKVKQ